MGHRQTSLLNQIYYNWLYFQLILMQSCCLYPISCAISEKDESTYEVDRYFTKITIFCINIFRSFLRFFVSNLVSNIEIDQILYIWMKNRHKKSVSTILQGRRNWGGRGGSCHPNILTFRLLPPQLPPQYFDFSFAAAPPKFWTVHRPWYRLWDFTFLLL